MRTTSVFLIAGLLAVGSTFGGELSKKDFKEAQKKAAMALSAGDDAALASALTEVGADDSKKAVDFLLKVALTNTAGQVYNSARQALAGMKSDEAVDHMVKLVEKRGDPRVKLLLIDAFSDRDDDKTGAALGEALSAREPEVLRAAVHAIGKRQPKDAVDGLIDLFEKLTSGRGADGLLMNSVEETLYQLTGQNFKTAEDWRKYWSIKKRDFRPRTGGAPREPSTTSERKKVPTFFGSEIRSNRIVFVIDTSGSMTAEDPAPPTPPKTGGPPPRRGPRTGGGTEGGDADGKGEEEESQGPKQAPSRIRVERAKFQLKEVIKELPQGAMFTIIGFDTNVKVFSKVLLAATPANKDKATAFVMGLNPSGTTMTLSAAKAAFDVEGADTMILLSDGAPTEVDENDKHQLTGEEVADRITELNRFKRWRIDTFGFAATGIGGFMRKLADENSGSYTDIP
ncbi:MAG: hypothetical protein KDD82_18835 [Planctomycetes bacterium]|nr:hypothetical protein [Planctomycetota bacterium]